MPFERYRKVVLDNGLRVLMDPDPSVCSASIGLHIVTGSKHESPPENGLAHFIEHMLFKGTESRSARDIAIAVDEIGGYINGGTSREYTYIEIKALADHFPRMLELIADMVFHSKIDSEDLETERGVILEEIQMYEDQPEDFIQDMIVARMWDGSPLGRPILGTKETVSSFDRDSLLDFMRKFYRPDRMIVSASGNFCPDELTTCVRKTLGKYPRNNGNPPEGSIPGPTPLSGKDHFGRPLSQLYMCLGFPGVSRSDDERYTLNVLNTMLGASMSSRLFQEVREKRGLVYSVYSYPVFCEEAGLFIVYLGTAPERYNQAFETVMRELEVIRREKPAPEEIRKAKEHLKGSLLLSMEGTKTRMSAMAKWELYYGRCFTVEEIVTAIESVSEDRVCALADRLLKEENMMVLTEGTLPKE